MNPLNSTKIDETVPVLIVGGSLVGLSLSLFLAKQGIKSTVVERHPGTAIHPRVSSLTARTMEIFCSAGVEEEIRRMEWQKRLEAKRAIILNRIGT